MKTDQAVIRVCMIFTVMLVSVSMTWKGTLTVTPASSTVAAERQNWKFFTNRSNINTVLLSDDGGTIWVGTYNGLEERHSPSGEIKQVYTRQNGLPNDVVNALFSDGQGGIWVGTYEGLGHLKSDRTWEIFNIKNSGLPDNYISSIAPDDQGGIWVGSGNNDSGNRGLAHLKPNGTWEVLNKDNSEIPAGEVECLLFDGEGVLWVSTREPQVLFFYDGEEGDGYDNYNNGGRLSYLRPDGSWTIFNTVATSLVLDGQGGIWVGTADVVVPPQSNGGWELFHLKPDGIWEVFRIENSEFREGISSLCSDGMGGLWAGSFGSLIHMKESGEWNEFDYNNSELPINWITSLSSDGQGGVWVGTYSDGLAHLKSDNTWMIDKGKSGLPDNKISVVISDDQGGLWIGTDWIEGDDAGGFAHLKADNSWRVYDKNNSEIPDNAVRSLCSDSKGGVWIGTSFYGLWHLKSNETWEFFDIENSEIPGYGVDAIFSDGNGGIWVGTEGGLGHLKPDGIWDIFDSDNSPLPNNWITSIVSDNQGGIWLNSYSYEEYSSSIAHLTSDTVWEVFNTEHFGLSNSMVTALLSDGQQGLWLGTDNNGLVHFKADGKWDIFNSDNSILLENGSIESIISDGQNGLWIGTSYFGMNNSGLIHLKSSGEWDSLDIGARSLLPDGSGGIWAGTWDGLVHLLLIGSPEQHINTDSPEIIVSWFLNSSPLDYQNVKYIELQRSLSKNGAYETVYDTFNNPVRFYADFSDCPNPRVENCWPSVDGHTPAFRQDPIGDTQIKGYTLNTPVTDPEWLEGLPRYYRLSAVIEEDDTLVRVANNQEAVLVTPPVEEKPRVELTLDRSAVAMLPGTKTAITVFASSLDLFTGNVILNLEWNHSDSHPFNLSLEPESVSLRAGETKQVLLQIEAFPENSPGFPDTESRDMESHNTDLISTEVTQTESTLSIRPVTDSGYHGKSVSLNLQTGTTPMIAIGIQQERRRPRVMDGITISGNIIPAQAGQQIVVSGNLLQAADMRDTTILATTADGYFEGSLISAGAGPVSLSARSNDTTSNTAELFILPAKTRIALTSNVNQETSQKDTLRIEGIMTPVRLNETGLNESRINLDIRYLDPSAPDGELKPQFTGEVSVNEKGIFYRDVVVPGDGFIHVTASLSETPDFLGINTKLVIPIGQPVGEGIIVVSESGPPEFQDISKSLGRYVYNVLKNRNIPPERIRYLGLSDEKDGHDENGENDESAIPMDGYADKNNIRHALTTWAVSLISKDDPYKTPLNLYLIGNIEDGKFRLNENELLGAEELAQYLDEAESLVYSNSDSDADAQQSGLPVTIVLEGAQSEKWIEEIAGEGRIVLTSSSAKPLDQGGFAGYDNLGESSFTRYFYQFINYGSDIEGSFAEANYEILKFYRHTQRPVMDADGDGVGTTKYDRYEASGKFIEYRPSGNLRPKIRTTHPDMTITDRENNTLWAIATDPEQEMKGVFCSITDPSDRSSHLELNPMDDRGNWYEVKLENFSQTGCHQVVYYAKDKAGNVSLPVERFLHVTDSALRPDDNPEDPVDEPDDSAGVPQAPTLTLTMEGSQVSISWTAVPDADGYTLLYAPYPDAEQIGSFDMGSQTSITFNGTGFAFYVAVKAFFAKGNSELSNIESFDLR